MPWKVSFLMSTAILQVRAEPELRMHSMIQGKGLRHKT